MIWILIILILWCDREISFELSPWKKLQRIYSYDVDDNPISFYYGLDMQEWSTVDSSSIILWNYKGDLTHTILHVNHDFLGLYMNLLNIHKVLTVL